MPTLVEHRDGRVRIWSGPELEGRVVVSRRALSRHTLALVDEVLGLGAHDRVLVGLPLAHSSGCRMGLLAPLAAGVVVHLVRRARPVTAGSKSAQSTCACSPGKVRRHR